MDSLRTSRPPLPGLVKLYLCSLYASVLSLAALAVYLGFILAGRHFTWIEDYIPVLCLLAVAGVGLWNIFAIHARSRNAPRVSLTVLGLSAVLGSIAAGLLLWQALDDVPPFGGEYANLWTGLMQSLVLTAAWFLYWKRSAKAWTVFGLAAPEKPATAAPSLEFMRLAGVYILVTGFCYSLSFALYHFDQLSQPTAYPGHWLIFGLPLALLLFNPERVTQKSFDRLGWLLIIWMAVLAVLSLAHLSFPLSPDLIALRVHLPGRGLPLDVEAVLVIAMFWYVAWRSVIPTAGDAASFWARRARAARAAGVRGLDALYIPLLLFVMSNSNAMPGQHVAHYAYIGLLGIGLIIATGILILKPHFFITYMRCFSVAAPIIFLAGRLAGGIDGYGPSLPLLYAVGWSNVVIMLLGTAYFLFRDRLTEHPAMVFMRFTAWGCIALSGVMLMHLPSFFDMADDLSRAYWWTVNVGFPWIYLPFAAGLLYAARGRSGWNMMPSPLLTASVIGLMFMLCAEKFLTLFLCAVQSLPLKHALVFASEGYGPMLPPEFGVACALAVCLWALGVSGKKQAPEK